ncbi:MAG: efflux RND transporter periplasmic adaptor subunit [Halopseudomonas sp.]
MNKTAITAVVALALGLSIGAGRPWLESTLFGHDIDILPQASANEPAAERPLFYRNPMNPAITSPVPAQDEMGMEYIPVYPEKKAAKAEPLFYRNPMNPAITSPVAAQDEMGMDYIPVYADDAGDSASDEPSGTVKIDPVMVQNIGVRTVLVEQRNLVKQIRATGRITVDDSRMTRIHPRTEGWVEKQFISRVGDSVRKGDELLQLYSPQLVTSQQEYLLALENLEALKESRYVDIRTGAEEMLNSSYQRLLLLDMPKHEIKELQQSRQVRRAVSIESPFDGVALSVGTREGQFVMPKTELYMLADLSKVWMLADVYEYELPWIAIGDTASMKVTGMRDKQFEGTVSYIYPYAESKTRTVKVRIEFDNAEGLLKPDMFADITIGADARPNAVVVPNEAIVRSGSREQVFVVRDVGKFEPREVELGYSSDGWVEIRSGLQAGERVVSSALFLIDSESKLREATAKMMEALQAEEPDAGLSLEGMSMDSMSMDELSMDELSMDGSTLDGMSMDTLSMDDLSMDQMSMDPLPQSQQSEEQSTGEPQS